MEIPVFYSYSHKDENFRKELVTHLELLRRNNLIAGWSDREIAPGSNWEEEINFNIQKAKIILLLISPDFIASDYCYETETIFALEQHENNKAKVVPIIIRPCLWKLSQFSHLQVLPKEGKALTTWENKDSAWLNVAEGIIKVVEELRENRKKEIQNSKNVVSDSNIKASRDIVIGDSNYIITNHGSIEQQVNIEEIHLGTGDIVRANKIIHNEKEDISHLVQQFLKDYNQWYFSPLRINKWGGRQIGYEKLSESNSKEIRQALEKLKKQGAVKTTKSKKGNTIYKIED
ncbi:MAG: toll/interleukin-1 receptor domain-containing protein [Saprospiraceae bacterium]